jgi:hypothetical protein
MKLLVRFLLVFSLLFLVRYEYLYAFTASQGAPISIAPAHSDNENNERQKAIELAEEEDDDKLGSFKHLVSGGTVPSFQYTTSPGYPTVNIRSATSLYTHALFSSLRKYILFGAFRI